jgi:hypothetical protein
MEYNWKISNPQNDKTMMSNYYKPTPKKWRKIGDAILLGCSSLSLLVMGSPMTDNGKAWAVFIINSIGVAGKVITNMFKEDEQPVNETN